MKRFLVICCLLLFFCLLINGCEVPNMKNLELNKDTNLYAGEGEICENPYIKVNCAEGLECKLVSSKPHIIRTCYPPGKVLDEDFVNRQVYENENYMQQQTSQ